MKRDSIKLNNEKSRNRIKKNTNKKCGNKIENINLKGKLNVTNFKNQYYTIVYSFCVPYAIFSHILYIQTLKKPFFLMLSKIFFQIRSSRFGKNISFIITRLRPEKYRENHSSIGAYNNQKPSMFFTRFKTFLYSFTSSSNQICSLSQCTLHMIQLLQNNHGKWTKMKSVLLKR